MTQTTNKEKQEKVIFYKKVVLEVVEKEEYSQLLEEYITFREVKINEKDKFAVDDWGTFEDILESLTKKVQILKYLNDETYRQMQEEILTDIGKLIYKMEYKHRT